MSSQDKARPTANNDECSCTSCNKPQHWLLRRHFSTIGIGAVFLEPPPSHMLPQNYLDTSADNSASEFQTWEIVGRIKSTPEDFLVREIAARKIPGPAQKERQSSYQIADLVQNIPSQDEKEALTSTNEAVVNEANESLQNDHSEASITITRLASSVDAHPTNKRTKIDNEQPADPSSTVTQCGRKEFEQENTCNDEVKTAVEAESIEKETELAMSPADVLTKILEASLADEAYPYSKEYNASGILTSMESLHRKALEQITALRHSKQDVMPCDWHVLVPPIRKETSCLQQSSSMRGGDRGAFHRALKVAFPLLRSESIKGPEDHPDAKEGEPWIRISIDTSFLSLVPMLHQPEVDLPDLYLFRNRGCELQNNNKGEAGTPTNNRGRQKKGSRSHGKGGGRHSETNRAPNTINDSGESHAILRLRQDLPREERRCIHQLIAKACRDLETSTIPNFPIQSSVHPDNVAEQRNDASFSEYTAAVVVKWSKKARNFARKKRKRSEKDTAANGNSNVLCVLKKRQKEHLTALQHLTTAIRCRQSDIGLAGTKDMQAMTYQFCTIRDSTIQRVRKANSYLIRRNMELGTFHKVDWTLSNGDLEGNRFEIVVRDLARVAVHRNPHSGHFEESFAPCKVSHIKQMSERIRRSGFINFYGEQRLGIAGDVSEVGVRPFDIGKAMLQQDFAKAIDLLMAGRLRCRGDSGEGEEIRLARQVWKDSEGDPVATLKALPRGEALARERTVLKGLKRHGKSDPIQAIKCLNFGVRTFWINAYQSYVWNFVATERIKRFGARVVQGDLFVKKDGEKNDVQVVGENPSLVDLSQVVLPLPGYSIQYPLNEIGKLYKDILERDSVDFQRDAPPEATAKGSYRHLISFARNLQLDFSEAFPGETTVSGEETADVVKLTFELKSGSYATSMLREQHCTTCDRS